jgi:hypothetical protein
MMIMEPFDVTRELGEGMKRPSRDLAWKFWLLREAHNEAGEYVLS